MPSLALCMIVKDEVDAVESLLTEYRSFFEQIVIAVSDKEAYKQLRARVSAKDCDIFYRQWTDDFAAAREAVRVRVKTDYWFWIDADDTFSYPDRLHRLVDYMEDNSLDMLQLRYEYAHNEQGESIADHWRERLIRTVHEHKWIGAVHETLIADAANILKSDEITIVHHKAAEDMEQSLLRNLDILEKSYEKDQDPRTMHYLGLSYLGLKQYERAIEFLIKHIEASGWDEERYRSWCKIAEAEIMLDMPRRALAATNGAIDEKPDYPDAYYLKAMIYNELGQFDKVVEWIKVALSKPEPNTLSIVDPTLYKYRGMYLGALAYLQLGKIKKAWAMYQEVRQVAPDYEIAKEMQQLFEEAYYDDAAIDRTKWLLQYCRENGGKAEKLLQAIPYKLLADPRLNYWRTQLTEPTVWPKKSIVFYCGMGSEPWGPDTLDKGMGGSEEAIVYLAREMAKQGWKVMVFNDREDEYIDGEGTTAAVRYKPWTMFNPNDTFDVIVAWRTPAFFNGMDIKARLKCIDLHDAPTGHASISHTSIENVDLFFFKSKFQTTYAKVPPEKVIIAPNGIVPQQFVFDTATELAAYPRNPHKVIYASSADRGLDVLCDLWPKVKEAVPDAELVWAYGWNTFDSFHHNNPERMKWKWQTVRKMQLAGIKDLGRLSHEDLAKEMLSCGAWAYPTSFDEISCITAMKAQAAGLDCITSGFAALQETVFKTESEISHIDTKPKELENFTQRLINTLKNPLSDNERALLAHNALEAYNWAHVAELWSAALK
jgi:tetratricopeptide (TPR) repeat protein